MGAHAYLVSLCDPPPCPHVISLTSFPALPHLCNAWAAWCDSGGRRAVGLPSGLCNLAVSPTLGGPSLPLPDRPCRRRRDAWLANRNHWPVRGQPRPGYIWGTGDALSSSPMLCPVRFRPRELSGDDTRMSTDVEATPDFRLAAPERPLIVDHNGLP